MTILRILRRAWCCAFHVSVMRPVGDTYRCATCLEQYDVPWIAKAPKVAASSAALPMEATR